MKKFFYSLICVGALSQALFSANFAHVDYDYSNLKYDGVKIRANSFGLGIDTFKLSDSDSSIVFKGDYKYSKVKNKDNGGKGKVHDFNAMLGYSFYLPNSVANSSVNFLAGFGYFNLKDDDNSEGSFSAKVGVNNMNVFNNNVYLSLGAFATHYFDYDFDTRTKYEANLGLGYIFEGGVYAGAKLGYEKGILGKGSVTGVVLGYSF